MDNRIDDYANQGDSSPDKFFFEGVRGWQAEVGLHIQD
jgi:hypothetical protein